MVAQLFSGVKSRFDCSGDVAIWGIGEALDKGLTAVGATFDGASLYHGLG